MQTTKEIINKINSQAWKNAGMRMVKRDFEAWAFIIISLSLVALFTAWVLQANYYDGIMLDHCVAFNNCVIINK